MAGSLNRVSIIGNLGRDPESRSFQNGGKVVNLSIGVSESWKDKSSGERKEKTEWVPIAIFNDQLCDVATRFLRKGSKILVEGKFSTRKWQDQSGNDRYSTEVVLQGYDARLVLLDKIEKSDRQESGGGGKRREEPVFDTDLDDDVPF